jgi:class 3 adenylate cyclase
MEPRIQYAKTSDGVTIAYWTMGEGPPLVVPPNLVASHLQMEWQVPWRREFYEHLASRATLVRYDCRGMGMSDRDALDFSQDAAILDLEAVVSRLDLERFALMDSWSGPVTSAYATRHTERVSHLVYLVVPPAWAERGMEIPRRLELLRPLIGQDWELYTEVMALVLAGADYQPLGPFGRLIRASHSPASIIVVEGVFAQPQRFDRTQTVSAPTLIIHQLGDDAGADMARELASALRQAHVVGVPGRSMGPYLNEAGSNAVLDFITAPSGEARAPVIDPGSLRAVLFTDIAGHTEMMQRLGDANGRAVLREHERITREVLKQHGGAEVKTMGDGFMASFPSITRAVESAIALQRAFEARTEGEPLRIRIGLGAGEPIEEAGDLFGSSVILAARIAASAGPGQILTSAAVRELCAGKGFAFADRHETSLKGFEEPVRLYEVGWREDG